MKAARHERDRWYPLPRRCFGRSALVSTEQTCLMIVSRWRVESRLFLAARQEPRPRSKRFSTGCYLRLLATLGLADEEVEPAEQQGIPDLFGLTKFFWRLSPIEADPAAGMFL